MKIRTYLVTSLLLSLLIFPGCLGKPRQVSKSNNVANLSGKIYFVPLAEFPLTMAQELAAHFRNKFAVAIEVLPSEPLDEAAVDSKRKQLIAEALVSSIKRRNPSQVNEPNSIIIGLTTDDMYIEKYNWNFCFGWRQEGKYAVISNARMHFASRSVSPQQIRSRLRKMVTRYIGLLYFRLPQNKEPRSVLYQNVDGLRELDFMGEDF
jgi:predicted Zn-dependent protease